MSVSQDSIDLTEYTQGFDNMRFLALFAIILTTTTLPLTGQAAVEGQAYNSQQFDQNTLKALRYAKEKQWNQALKQARAVSDNNIQSLIYWLKFQDKNTSKDFQNIRDFVANHPDWPRMSRIRLEAEKHMPDTLSYKEVIAWFNQYDPITPDGVERYVDALKASGQTLKAIKVLGQWWQTGSLTRDQQKRFFQKYKSDFLEKDHIKRFNALLQRGEYSNARAIARVLKQGYPELAEARIALAKSEPGVNTLIKRVPSHLKTDPGLLYERLRWRRREDLNDGAMNILSQSPSSDAMHSPRQWWLERHIITRRLIADNNYRQAYTVVSRHRQNKGLPFAQAQWLSGWIALQFLKEPWVAFEHFEKLYHAVKTPISKARAAYWAGRASMSLGYPDVAQKWYRVGGQNPATFYGQLSLAALGESNDITISTDNSFTPSPQSFQSFTSIAALLHNVGFDDQAKLFLGSALEDQLKNANDYKYAAQFAKGLGFRDVAIRYAQKSETKFGVPLLDLAYPTLPLSSSRSAEEAFIYAIIRQESRFDTTAISSAGARGLMQLMPATAKEVARKEGISHKTEWLTRKPDHNIRLGSRYLQKMVDRFDGNYAMAAAAYNAGPGRVSRWIKEYGDPRKGEINIIDWIELIPIYETRNYVQRVLEATYVYRFRTDQGNKAQEPLLHIAMHM